MARSTQVVLVVAVLFVMAVYWWSFHYMGGSSKGSFKASPHLGDDSDGGKAAAKGAAEKEAEVRSPSDPSTDSLQLGF